MTIGGTYKVQIGSGIQIVTLRKSKINISGCSPICRNRNGKRFIIKFFVIDQLIILFERRAMHNDWIFKRIETFICVFERDVSDRDWSCRFACECDIQQQGCIGQTITGHIDFDFYFMRNQIIDCTKDGSQRAENR